MTLPPYRPLGSTGLSVSPFCLGTATFGGQCDERESFGIMDRALDLGITFFDTADKYPLGSGPADAGVTESIIGRWWKGRRDQIILLSKVHGATGPRPWDGGLSRRHIMNAVEASLRRLNTDYLDIYQLHRPDPATPIDETLSTLDDIVRQGKVRYIGCANFLAYQLATALGRSDVNRWHRFTSLQSRYNLLFREHERELFPLSRQEGIGILAYNVLAAGMLTGKHRPDGSSQVGTRFSKPGIGDLYLQRYWSDDKFAAIEQLRAIADDAGCSLAALATAWTLGRPGISSVILGATRPEHLDQSVASSALVLEPSILEAANTVTHTFRLGDALQ